MQASLFDENRNRAPFIEDLVSSRIDEGGSELEASKDAYALLWAAAVSTVVYIYLLNTYI